MTQSTIVAVCGRSNASLSQQAYNRIRDSILERRVAARLPVVAQKTWRRTGHELPPGHRGLAAPRGRRSGGEQAARSNPRASSLAQEIRELYIVPEALESMAARLFAERASPKERQDLRAAARRLDEMFRCSVRGDPDAEFRFSLHKAHFNFHMQIAECTWCAALQRAIEKNQVLVFNWLYDVAAQHRRLPRQSHRELAESVCAQDPLAADAAIRQHIRYGAEEVLREIQPRLADEWRKRGKPWILPHLT